MIHKFRPFWVRSIDESPSGEASLVQESISDHHEDADGAGYEEPVEDISDDSSEAPDLEEDDSDQLFDDPEADNWTEEVDYDFPEEFYPGPEPEPDPAAAYGQGFEEPPQQFHQNPREQAYAEAQALGQDADWAENRAFEIYEDRQAVSNMHANAMVHIPVLAQQFEELGIPGGAAAPYYENLIKLTKQGFRQATQNPIAQRVALAHAIGEYVIREQESGRHAYDPPEPPRPRSMVTPTSSTSRSRMSVGGLSKQDQRFVSQWQATHNGGRPATSKQLAALQAEGLIG